MNKKGFTLIEILAVLVILSIILLITMPIINDVVNDSRKNTFKISLESLVKVIKNDYQGNVRYGEVKYQLEDNTLVCDSGCPEGKVTIKYKGDLKDAVGTITMNGTNIKMDINTGVYHASYETKKCILEDYKKNKTNCTEVLSGEEIKKCGSDGNLCKSVEHVLVTEIENKEE